MIPDKNEVTTEGNLAGEKIAMKVHEDSFGHVMDVMANLYADTEGAVIREYSTNAWDAQLAAGVSTPIEVTLPTQLSPFFKVRDRGVGLSVQDIHDIYSQYGASTKRASNDYNGTLGFGCKSALGYGSQFTVIGVKGGVRTQVVVSRDEEGGSMTVVDTSTTDDEAGVEIQVPVKRGHNFDRKARKFFAFWPKGTVLINGSAPDHFTESSRLDVLKLSDKIFVAKNENTYAADPNLVVMGNVAYPVKSDEFPATVRDGYRLIMFVPNGTVQFTPAREGLRYTKQTKAMLHNLLAEFKRESKAVVQRDVDACASPYKVIKVILDWRKALPGVKLEDFTYKGKRVPEDYKNDALVTVPRHRGYSFKLGRHEKPRNLPAAAFPDTLWFCNFHNSTFSASMRRKIDKWMENNAPPGLDVQRYALVSHKPASDWIDPALVHDWAAVHAIKLPMYGRSYGPTKTVSGSYDYVWVNGVYVGETVAQDIDQTKPIIYQRGNKGQVDGFVDTLTRLYPGCTVVAMSENRLKKFARDFPDALRLGKAVSGKFDSWMKGLTDIQRLALRMDDEYNDRVRYGRLDEKRILDPELRRYILAAKTNISSLRQDRGKFIQVMGYVRPDPYVDILEKKYPLANTSHPHCLPYINMVYKAGL